MPVEIQPRAFRRAFVASTTAGEMVNRVGRKVPGGFRPPPAASALPSASCGVGLDAESMGHDFPKRLQLIAVAESLREGCVVLSRTLPWALTEKCCQARTRMPVIKYVHFRCHRWRSISGTQ